MLRGNSYIYHEDDGTVRSEPLPPSNPGQPVSHYRRAVVLQQLRAWPDAFREFDAYIRSFGIISQGITGNKALADAFYGRAVCNANLGSCVPAVLDLQECVRVGPEDEQITDEDVSRVPAALVALFVLLNATPEVRTSGYWPTAHVGLAHSLRQAKVHA